MASMLPNESGIDQFVGKQLKAFRIACGMSQHKLAKLIGVTFQQVQKYEHGRNRLSAGKIYALAQILQVPVQSFFPQHQSSAYEPPPPGMLHMTRVIAKLTTGHHDDLLEILKAVDRMTAVSPSHSPSKAGGQNAAPQRLNP